VHSSGPLISWRDYGRGLSSRYRTVVIRPTGLLQVDGGGVPCSHEDRCEDARGYCCQRHCWSRFKRKLIMVPKAQKISSFIMVLLALSESTEVKRGSYHSLRETLSEARCYSQSGQFIGASGYADIVTP
jgi:hypothetical protein